MDAWRRFCATLAEAEVLVDAAAPAEGYRYLARFLAAGLASCIVNDDPNYPRFHRMIDYATPWGLDHPDALYLYAPLAGGERYRLFGERGSANVIDVQINAGHFSSGDVRSVQTLWSRELPQGAFELELPVFDDARFLHVRQYFADWERERPADLIVERDGASWPIPTPSTERVAEQLATLEAWIARGGRLWQALSERFAGMPANTVSVHRVETEEAHGALAGQVYAMGNFSCEPDEAVVIEFEPPRCAHWNVALANGYWETVEYASRQSSLNHHQAAAGPLVIAHEDPGYLNWLDPGGVRRGTIALRFHRAESEPEIRIERRPWVELDLGQPRIDPAARREALTRRRRAVIGRHRM